MRLAVIGLAGVGANHIEKISNMENAELACVCDIVENIADDAGKKYSVKAYYDAEKMIADEKLDGVITCNSTKEPFPFGKDGVGKRYPCPCRKAYGELRRELPEDD